MLDKPILIGKVKTGASAVYFHGKEVKMEKKWDSFEGFTKS